MFFTGGGWQGSCTMKMCFFREAALTLLKARTLTVNSPSLGDNKAKMGSLRDTCHHGFTFPTACGVSTGSDGQAAQD